MKKVALATCFLDNFGACLQALALQNEIEKLGYECRILAYIEPNGYFQDDNYTIFKKRIRNVLTNVLHYRERRGKTNYFKHHYAFYKFRNKYLKFDKDPSTGKVKYYRSLDDFSDVALRYDAFVCGSDQIWNPTFYNKNNPVYFLRFAKDKKRIAYAPSIGLSDIPEKHREAFIEYVTDFDSLSVREQAGADIIQALCSRSAKVVLDPTLLAGVDFWRSILKSNYKIPFEKYIFCYIFSNTEKCSNYIKDVQSKTNLPIVYMDVSNLDYSKTNSFCARHAGPLDFLYMLNNAEFIVTDSFHGTAFSLLFNKNFYIFKRERCDEKIDMYSRIESILSATDLKNRACSLDAPFELKERIDYVSVNKKLDTIRQDSKKYLSDALSGE